MRRSYFPKTMKHSPLTQSKDRLSSNLPFYIALFLLSGFYLALIVALLIADIAFISPQNLLALFSSPEIRYSMCLSLLSSSLSALFSLWIAVPTAYLFARYDFAGKNFLDALLDIPIVLPPLVVGLSLLILFQTPAGESLESIIPFTYAVPGVILAQFTVACAFAIRVMRASFEQNDPRREQVALTLGCSRAQSFWLIAFPEVKQGMLAAGTMAWARSLGEFGPVLIFCGTTRMRTEVLPTSIFLEMSSGNLHGAVAIAVLMIVIAVLVLAIIRATAPQSPTFAGNYR